MLQDDDHVVLQAVKSSAATDWSERCTQLELSLQRFKSHSGKVRQALLDKIVRLERRAIQAEAKVLESEAQVAVLSNNAMERRRSESRGSSNSSCASPDLSHLQSVVDQKEKVITKLESEVEEQKKLRLQDAKQVEVKAAKIKEWVAHKLKELEDQNETLREENRKYNDQLKTLEGRLEGASPESRRKIESAINSLNRKKGIATPSLPLEPSYAVVDPRRKGKGFGYRSPKRFPRKDFVPLSSSSDDEAECLIRNVSSPTRKPIPPPRMARVNANYATYANIPGTPQLNKRRGLPEEKSARGGSLDRKLADMQKLNFGEIREKRKQALAAAVDELHDYSEIYTPSKETKRFESKPPTPPLHRCPSWESRIYKVASTSINSATTTPTHSIRSNFRNCETSNGLTRPNIPEPANPSFYCPNIPVYATIQGKASQIRPIPFSGDSSDSSDNETDGRVTSRTTTTTSSTSGDGSNHDIYSAPTRVFQVKRGNSIESALSDDYDIPPDALVTSTHSRATLCRDDQSEPRTPRRFSSLRRDPTVVKQEVLEKNGNLVKLGGKLKTWNRRWFVLKNGVLTYYKSQSDVLRNKARGQIKLDENCRLLTSEGSASFQISVILGAKKKEKVYYLAADSREAQNAWCKLIQETLKRNTAGFTYNLSARPTVEGWVTKVKHGHSKRTWCALVGKTFIYFKSPSDVNPLGYINMRQTKVEEVNQLSDSDNEEPTQVEIDDSRPQSGDSSAGYSKYTIAVTPKYDSSPIYLLLATKQDMDSWLYHLTVVSCSDTITGTPFEHVVSKLMQSDSPQAEVSGIDSNVAWADPLLLHTKDKLHNPLTTLPSEELRNEALQLFKSLQLFITVPLDSAGIDYHVSLVQNSFELCLSRPELQNEIYAQLIKQTSPATAHRLCPSGAVPNFFLCATQSLFTCDASGTSSEKTSPTNVYNLPSVAAIGASAKMALDRNKKLPDHIFVQGFQLLALAIPLFLPKGRVMWLLKQHLRRSADSKSDIGQFAIYCQRALERSILNGARKYRPSRMEVLGILLRNPYQHSLPHSIPVHFVNETYMVVGFDGSSTIKEFVALLCSQANIREPAKSGFRLYSDDPIDKQGEHLLEEDSKLADQISMWEMALRERRLGKFENTKVVRIYFKQRLFIKENMREALEKEKLLLVYQINIELMAGRFPVTQELNLELCALLAQIEYGSVFGRNFGEDILRKVVNRFYPPHMLEYTPVSGLLADVKQKWGELENCTTSDCVRIYLNCARKWSLCGATLFQATARKPLKMSISGVKSTVVASETVIWIAVSDDAISILDFDTMHVLQTFLYRNIVTFGGSQEDFMLVVNSRAQSDIECGSASGSAGGSSTSDGSSRHEKLLFGTLSKTKLLQLTLLIADYINCQAQTLRGAPLSKCSQSFDCSLDARLGTPVRSKGGASICRSNTRI